SRLARLARQRRRGGGRHRSGRGWHAAEARGLRRGDRRRRAVRPHHRRVCASLAAFGAVHGCRHRHHGHSVSVDDLMTLEALYAMPTYARAPVEFVRGEGARLWDADGKEYLDFFAGLSVHNAGHCHPRIVAAIREQAGRLGGVSNLYYTAPAMRLCERLVESSLGGRVFLCNSGTEANECVIKLARKHAHGRGVASPEIVVLDGAFHGRTLGTLAATPRLANQDRFGP